QGLRSASAVCGCLPRLRTARRIFRRHIQASSERMRLSLRLFLFDDGGFNDGGGPGWFARPLIDRPRATSATPAIPVSVAVAAHAAARAARLQVAVIGGFYVGNVQEAVAAYAEIHKCRLDARLDVNDAAFVDIADVALVARSLDVQLFQHAVFQDGNPALLRLQDVDQHLLLHVFPFWQCAAGSRFEDSKLRGPATIGVGVSIARIGAPSVFGSTRGEDSGCSGDSFSS